jgi:hypothetical protein
MADRAFLAGHLVNFRPRGSVREYRMLGWKQLEPFAHLGQRTMRLRAGTSDKRSRVATLSSTVAWLAWIAAEAVVKLPEGAALRSGGCDQDAEVIATLPAGTRVDLQSSIVDGGGVCFRAVLEWQGRTLRGNIAGSAVAGTETFDQARMLASGGSESVQVTTARQVESLRKTLSEPSLSGSGPILREASRLLDANQPARALEVLGPHVGAGHPDVLVLAGVAAWKSDQVKLAIEHWKAAQSLRPRPELQAMILKLENEAKHDRSNEKLIGLRVALRYEGQSLPYDTAKSLVQVLDSEVIRISEILGCSNQERLTAIVQSPEDYRQGSNAAEWSGGQFDGSRIRIPIPAGARVDDNLRRIFAHEVTHACLANLGSWPAWLHEGLAQKLSGERLPAPVRESLQEMASRKQLPKLQEFRRDWSGLNAANARLAYAVSLAAADQLVDHYGASIGLRTILSNPSILLRITGELNRHLGLDQ